MKSVGCCKITSIDDFPRRFAGAIRVATGGNSCVNGNACAVSKDGAMASFFVSGFVVNCHVSVGFAPWARHSDSSLTNTELGVLPEDVKIKYFREKEENCRVTWDLKFTGSLPH